MFRAIQDHCQAKSAALLRGLEDQLRPILRWWLLLAALASTARVAASPASGAEASMGMVAPYLLLVIAPAVSMALALSWFNDGARWAQPRTRLAIVGHWQNLTAAAAMRHPLYGAGGIMVSLLIGMLINIPLRAAEYLTAIPALSGSVPQWLSTLHLLMTFDVVLLTSLYAVAFAAALRRVPLFPRLLVAIWLIDIVMQLAIAKAVAAAPGLPHDVATSLAGLLEGNVQKVIISIALWLPYLLLSERVNVTYRHRIPA